jgi:hypothetical protein
MDRAINSAAARELGIGGVHDRVHVLLGDVALHDHESRHASPHHQ